MKTGVDIMAYYQTFRDHSGNVLDEYAQTLDTFLMHAQFNNEVEEFYKLLIKAEKLNKHIDYKEMPEDIMYDDYFVSEMILVDKK
jgi:hypothetical protein